MTLIWNDIVTLILAVLTVLNFSFGRGDKSSKNSYRQGQIDQQLKDIKDDLEDIKRSIIKYTDETKQEIAKAIKDHEEKYHNRGGK